MPLVMVDTNFSLPATLSRGDGVARKMWVLFAYGAASFRAEQLALDDAELAAEHSRKGGEVNLTQGLRQDAEAAVARLNEVLPIGTPDDWMLAGSQACWDEYEEKALVVSGRLGRQISPQEAAKLRRSYESLCVVAPRPAYAYDVPQLTPDPDDDLLLFDAMRAGADIFVSDDPHVVPKSAGGSADYEHDDLVVRAMTSDYFREHYLADIDWDGIDPTLR